MLTSLRRERPDRRFCAHDGYAARAGSRAQIGLIWTPHSTGRDTQRWACVANGWCALTSVGRPSRIGNGRRGVDIRGSGIPPRLMELRLTAIGCSQPLVLRVALGPVIVAIVPCGVRRTGWGAGGLVQRRHAGPSPWGIDVTAATTARRCLGARHCWFCSPVSSCHSRSGGCRPHRGSTRDDQ